MIAGLIDDSCDDLLTIRLKIGTQGYASPLGVIEAVRTLMQMCRNSIDNKRSPVSYQLRFALKANESEELLTKNFQNQGVQSFRTCKIFSPRKFIIL